MSKPLLLLSILSVSLFMAASAQAGNKKVALEIQTKPVADWINRLSC